MKKYIDITGTINNGMWNYDEPFPQINIKPLPPISWLGGKTVGCEIFEGFHSQTGTYLETPAHQYGHGNAYALIEVPVEKLYNIPCVVLNVGMWDINPILGCRAITLEHLQSCFNADQIREGDAILVGTGWSRYWFHPDYLKYSPYFTKEAMEWLLSKKPCLIGGDSARWDSNDDPQGFFGDFYAADILMAAPLANLESCTAARCKLTILPVKAAITSCAPCRAIVVEE